MDKNIVNESIIIVSGLPRSGTSMMMKMLEAGGLEPVTDGNREPNIDNPKGYYEYEKVKTIKEDTSWLKDIKGKVVKMVSKLLFELPDEFDYKIIFMERDLNEVLKSQKKMLDRLDKKKPKVDNKTMRKYYINHINKVKKWLNSQNNIDYIIINYNSIIKDTYKNIYLINEFFDTNIDTEKMLNVIDMKLYRNKA